VLSLNSFGGMEIKKTSKRRGIWMNIGKTSDKRIQNKTIERNQKKKSYIVLIENRRTTSNRQVKPPTCDMNSFTHLK